jgi:HAD superfamily hydrolase (TIGR01509 family)
MIYRMPPMNRPVRAVFFDFGGTLFSYRDLTRSSFRPVLAEAVERLGVDASLRDAGMAYGRASGESFREFSPKPYYLHRDLFMDTYRRFALALGSEPEVEFTDWFYQRQRAMFFEGCELRQGCIETLTALRDEGIHVAIVSNIDDDYLLPMIDRVGLDHVLDAWTSSEEAASCKPHGAIFDRSMEKAGVTGEQAFFVGDSPVHDIAGARRVGMQTVLIREPGQEAPGADGGEPAKAHYVIEELNELLPIVL